MAVIVRGSTSLFSFRQKVIPDTSITKVQITETLRHWEYKKNRRGLTFEILFSSTQDEYVTLVTCQLKTFIPEGLPRVIGNIVSTTKVTYWYNYHFSPCAPTVPALFSLIIIFLDTLGISMFFEIGNVE